jgi:hypothetical protein
LNSLDAVETCPFDDPEAKDILMKLSPLFTMTGLRASCRTGGCATLLVALLALIQGCASTGQTTFASADDAVQSLITSLRANDKDKLHDILGTDGDKILSSGDEVADRQGIEKFLTAYDEKHQLTPSDDGGMTLVVGNKDWPLPIPVVKDEKTNKWSFDTAAGKEEILNRRIGRNELTVIKVCEAIADAQKEYVERDRNGDGVPEYAQKFMSDPGKKNGLYWPTAEGEQASPLGEFVADAVEEGYKAPTAPVTEPRPFHGYLYRMLKSQGSSAPGGALDYVVNGRMIGGFAAVAYPAEYDNSGIMTFMVDFRGTVYQKDLGPDTAKIAREMTAFDPGPGWAKVESAETPAP